MRTLALVLMVASTAWAYDSKCYHPDGGICAEGPDAARNRWLGPLDEHRELFSRAAAFSGVPGELFVDFDLPVFLGDQTVSVEGRAEPSFISPSLSAVKVAARRTTTVAEFAQLPDFSYSLADWALGNETCPVDAFLSTPVDAERCHAFSGHMGALNSNHFLPQAREFYVAYHSLALARAAECRHLNQGIPAAARDRFTTFFTDCQREALILEAIGQHFLQDAFSAGHMWERWGSPDPRDFPDLPSAVAIAMTAGLIHGVRGVAQDAVGLGPDSAVEFDDALCAPHDEVQFVGGQFSTAAQGVGDLYATQLNTNPRFEAQRAQFYSCSVSGLRAVYEATGELPGAPSGTGLRSVEVTSDACFGQRVTNAAMWRGAGIDFSTTSGVHTFLPLEPWLAGYLVPILGGTATGGLGDPTQGNALLRVFRYRVSVLRLASQLTFTNASDPDGTSLARGELHPLLGIEPNGHYAMAMPRSPYFDPPLPWGPVGGSQPVDVWKSAIARTFHRAHALDWCHAFAAGGALDLESLKTAVSTAAPGSQHNLACEVCTEFAVRHVRQGTGVTDYQRDQEPLCGHFEGDGAVQFIYQPSTGQSAQAAAQKWCGCSAPLVSTGPNHTCAVLPEGTMKCWGSNSLGMLGTGTEGFQTSSTVPVPVVGLSAATDVQVLANATCAVVGDMAKCWGLLTGLTTSQTTTLTPTDVPSLFPVASMSAGSSHFCALLDGGTVKCTGDNRFGQVGNGTTNNLPGTPAPVTVVGLGPAISVTAGTNHSCAALADGTVWCWGQNTLGQLGDGTMNDSHVPVNVPGMTGVIQVEADDGSSCALRANGTVACWGVNNFGQLGDGTTTLSKTPVEVVAVTDATALAVGGGHACVIRRTGTVACWGRGSLLGAGITATTSTAVEVVGLTNVVHLSAGPFTTCAASAGSLSCWSGSVPVRVMGL
jgi:alpha-tubulin suppressor-like RCC1 family protein